MILNKVVGNNTLFSPFIIESSSKRYTRNFFDFCLLKTDNEQCKNCMLVIQEYEMRIKFFSLKAEILRTLQAYV